MGGENVFIKDKDLGWRPAIQESNDGKHAVCTVPQYADEYAMACDGGKAATGTKSVKVALKDYQDECLPMQNVDASGNLLEFPDMVKLPYLHEPGLLYNIKKRHGDGKPYTRTGDIVLAINPFQWFTEIYTDEVKCEYSNKLVWQASDMDAREVLEPHIYECSALCYKGLAFDKHDQSILVSGESGAGKTETVKIAMNHMASVQKGPTKPGETGGEMDPVVARIVKSNPLLESYGNASTRRNDNSSRFGKYLQLQFDKTKQGAGETPRTHSTCILAGSKCDAYLLEKNRVTFHDAAERTYHVFYQICAAPDEDKKDIWPYIVGKTNYDFKWVGHSNWTHIEKMTDAQHYQNTLDILKVVNCPDDKLKQMWQAICAVMMCGNLAFGPKDGDDEKSAATTHPELKEIAWLMGVDEHTLELAFTERTMTTRGESYKVPLNPAMAQLSCDSFAKDVYQNVFLWIVQAVNNATCAEDNWDGGGNSSSSFGIVGLLDIFGFESFPINRFDQLCINYANEKLQQKFTEDVFRGVQDEYEAEGIDLDQISYDDNSDVLELMEAKTGLLAMLNEVCKVKGSDQDFVSKAFSNNKKCECLLVNKLDRCGFGVHHYAGKVIYSAQGFVDSNNDSLPVDLVDLAKASTNVLISTKIEQGDPDDGKKKKAAPTIWGKYKTQLSSLMGNLRKTNSRYIRCLKPNKAKKPIIMDHIPCVEQLRCAGVVAAVTLANAAFPNNTTNENCVFKYSLLWDKKAFPSKNTTGSKEPEGLRQDAEAILACALKDKKYVDKDGNTRDMSVCGKTKSYFKGGALEYLEAKRGDALRAFVVCIQKWGRMFLGKLALKKLIYERDRAEIEAREAAERAEREAREAAEKAEREAREAAEKAEREAREAAEKAEREAREAAEKAEREAREEAEKAEREAREAAEKAEREARERREKIEKELREKYKDKLADHEANVGKEKRETEEKLEKLEKELADHIETAATELAEEQDRVKKLEEEVEKLREFTTGEAQEKMKKKKKGEAVQKKKLDIQTRSIDDLKKENKKMRKEHNKVKDKWEKVHQQHEDLLKQTEDAGAAFDKEDDKVHKIDDKNATVRKNLDDVKATNKDLKEKTMAKQDDYMGQAEARLEYQKTMAKILNMINEGINDARLCNELSTFAMDCEAESKTIMSDLELETAGY